MLPAHSATLLKAIFLPKLDEAFRAILEKSVRGEKLDDGRREYRFGSFSIVVRR